MKSFIWKIRCAFWMRRLLGISAYHAWGYACSVLENINGDMSECTPREAAEEEFDAWISSQ